MAIERVPMEYHGLRVDTLEQALGILHCGCRLTNKCKCYRRVDPLTSDELE